MILPSSTCGDRTEEVGYFETSSLHVASWLVEGLSALYAAQLGHVRIESSGSTYATRPIPLASLEGVGDVLGDRSGVNHRLLIPVEGWTAMLTDGPGGTDLGILPTHAVRELGCRVVRAVAGEPGTRRPPGTILDVFDPSVDDGSRLRRSISATDQGAVGVRSNWVFDQYGEPFAFEELDAYRRRRIRDRFGPDLLERYLLELGVPANGDFDYQQTVIVERATR